MDKNNEQSACNGDQHEADPVDNMDEDAAAKEKLTAGDPNKVKFTSVNLDGYDGKNGEAKVDIQVSQTTVGMGKDELMKYANEPFWVRLRLFLFILFWVAWFVMLIGAIIIIILAPRCPPPPKVAWFQYDALYQVDVETFQDSDGNGIGDFKGLISRLDYFKRHSVGALLLNPFYKSENGGIVDHKEIDEKLGTLEDFEELVAQLKKRDMYLVIDFNPNHSSDKHPWFEASVENQEPYKDFYIWANSATGSADKSKPPNNWPSVEEGSAWEWNDNRQQFYFHSFGKNKPDLNLRNELVRQELREIVKFWLEKGVDGIKVTAASHLIEEADLSRDEALGVVKSQDTAQYKDFNHAYTHNQPENIGLFEEWKSILTNFTSSFETYKILAAEVSGPVNATISYYGNKTNRVVDLMYNNDFAQITEKSLTGIELKQQLDVTHLPDFAWPALLFGSKDVSRLASRVGEDLVDAIHMAGILHGSTPIVYYGDELGIPDFVPEGGESLTSLTVMLWNNDTSSGFTSGSAQFPVHTNYPTINVEYQENSKTSHLKTFSKLLSLRKQPAITLGYIVHPVVTEEIFSQVRVRKGSPGYLFAVNLSQNSTTVDFSGKCKYLPEMARVEIRSSALTSGILTEGDHPKIALNNVPLSAKQAVVFSFVPIFD